jgi:hypothetical protein
MEHAISIGKTHNCYKCILDCSPHLESFYRKHAFEKKGLYMGLYF